MVKRFLIILTILILPIGFLMGCGCQKKNYFEGEICQLEFKEAYTTTIIIPVSVYNGNTVTVVPIPYIRSYPDRYFVKVRKYDENKQVYEYNECYVTKECFEKLEIGGWFVYDSKNCFDQEPYTQKRQG